MSHSDLSGTLLRFVLEHSPGGPSAAVSERLDRVLCGAVLVDLLAGSFIGLDASKQLRHRPDHHATPTSPVLARSLEVLGDAPSPGAVQAWLQHLERGLPELRALVHRSSATRSRATRMPSTLKRLKIAVQPRATLPPHMATLLSLIDAVGMLEPILEPDELDRARGVIAWQLERQSIVRVVLEH